MANIPSGLILTSISVTELVECLAVVLEARISKKDVIEQLPDRVSLTEVMQITGLKKSAIYKMTMAGTIPHGKYGRLLIFSRTEILNWMNQQIVQRQSKDKGVQGYLRQSAKKQLK